MGDPADTPAKPLHPPPILRPCQRARLLMSEEEMLNISRMRGVFSRNFVGFLTVVGPGVAGCAMALLGRGASCVRPVVLGQARRRCGPAIIL